MSFFSSSNGSLKLMQFHKFSGECLENKEIKKPIVVVRGTVGSTSTVDNSCLGVFIEETVKMFFFLGQCPSKRDIDWVMLLVRFQASLDIEKMNAFGSVIPESKTNFLSRKEVPWYLVNIFPPKSTNVIYIYPFK